MKFDAVIFDFDGVLLESEYAGNAQIAAFLTEAGHPTSIEDALTHFSGLSGPAFLTAIERWIGGPLPTGFHEARDAEDARVLSEGLEEVAGARAFVRALPASLPRAIASSSSTYWIRRHLDHLGLRADFEPMIFSGREDVARGKPAPDLYIHVAERLGVAIERCLIIEDSLVGATAAVASGAYVVGLVAASHCRAGHGERLKGLGVHHVTASFEVIAATLFAD
jgi:HAD superfamily hydrolase (TIGR01509 family)